jgi:hypothetical protein
MTDLSEKLETCYAGALHDVLHQLGHHNCVLLSQIIALDSSLRLTGEIYTISGHADQT